MRQKGQETDEVFRLNAEGGRLKVYFIILEVVVAYV